MMMKNFFIIILSAFGLCLPLCSSDDKISEADKLWLFLPQELPEFLVTGYAPQKNSRSRNIFIKKLKLPCRDFRVFVQKL